MKKFLSFAVVAAALAAFGTGNAAAAVSCVFEAHVVKISAPNAGDSAYIVRSGSAILVNSTPCGTADVTNTQSIVVTGSPGSQGVTIDVSGGPFEPGYGSESSTPEIEFTVKGQDGSDTLLVNGSLSDDSFVFGTTGIKLNSDTDVDVSLQGVENVAANGNDGNDTISFAGDAQTGLPWPTGVNATGGNGDDTITGGEESDYITGDADNDTLHGGLGGDSLQGLGGNDSLYGEDDGDNLTGGVGNDTMYGGDDDDFFYAEATLDGNDTLVGGNGIGDYAYYSYRESGVNISLDDVANDGRPGSEFDNVQSDVENLSTGDGSDIITGSPVANNISPGGAGDSVSGGYGPDSISGGPGADTLNGGGDGDYLYGGPAGDNINGGGGPDYIVPGIGNDTVDMGSGGDGYQAENAPDGADSVKGGTGNDNVYYGSRTGNVSITLDGTANDGESGELDDIKPDVEGVTTGSGNDTIVGSAIYNSLSGQAGNDTINGGFGQDFLYGGADNDTLTGGDGFDYVYAHAGADHLRLQDGGADYGDGGSDADVDVVDNQDVGLDSISNIP